MKTFKLCVLIAATAFLVGCASPTKNLRDYVHADLKPGDRVGLIVDADETPNQKHVGLMVFSNFDKVYPYKWALKSAVYGSIKSRLVAAGFEVVDLESLGFQAVTLANPVVQDGSSWRPSEGRGSLLAELKERSGTQAVIVVNKSRALASMECSGGPCSRFDIEGSGLVTRSKYPFFYSAAVAAFTWNIISFRPLLDLAKVEPLRKKLQLPTSAIPEFKEPKDFSNVSEQEFLFVRDAIANFSGQVTDVAANLLRP